MRLVTRDAETVLPLLSREFPIIAVTGPRQSGKTTLVRMAFPEKPYANLEDPDERAFARDDPRGFLARFPKGAVVDEAQRCPALFSYIQRIVDERQIMGMFVLSGSQQFGLLDRISQSLAGRVGLLHLLPFSMRELERGGFLAPTLDALMFKGAYPAVHERAADPRRWYNNYSVTYVERDVRQLANIQDLGAFDRLLRLCAGATGQMVNLSCMAADCGVSYNTVKAWLGVMEASYLVFLLQPHFRNFKKRLVKRPKLYFYDTGLACRLLGIQEHDHLGIHPARGALFENWVVAELLKSRFHRCLEPNLFFWRNHAGLEIDILLDQGTHLIPIECKSGATVASDWFDALEKWLALSRGEGKTPQLVYGGTRSYIRHKTQVVAWPDFYAAELFP